MKKLLLAFVGFVMMIAPVQGASGTDLDRKLFEALKGGNLETVTKLVEQGADITRQSRRGDTYLHLVSSLGHVELVKYLVEKHGFKVEPKPGNFRSPFYEACKGGSLEVIRYLVEKGANMHQQSRFGASYLHVSARNGYLPVVRFLVETGGLPVDEKDRRERSPLLHACEAGSLPIIKYLVEKGADAAWRNKNGDGYLTCFGAKGGLDIARYLVDEQKLKVDTMDTENQTPLFYAAQTGPRELVAFLVSRGANIHQKNKSGMTPLFMSTANRQSEITRFLIEKGAEVNLQDSDGSSPLIQAVLSKELPIVTYLVKQGAQINIETEDNHTPLHYAVINNDVAMIRYLLDHGAKMDVQNDRQQTPLYLAAIMGSLDTVKLLVERGADGSIGDKRGRLPHQVARGKIKKYLSAAHK